MRHFEVTVFGGYIRRKDEKRIEPGKVNQS